MLISTSETRSPLTSITLVPELVTWRATVNPNSIAVVDRGHRITYQDLDRRSNQLAHHLQSLGIESQELIGLYFERSIDYVTGALAILKAGAAYVPLDPTNPIDRLKFMLKDAGVKVLLAHRRLQRRIGGRWRTLKPDKTARET